MRNILAATSALLLLSASTAFAADAVEEVPEAPVAVDTLYDWSGIYIGAFGGYGWGNLDVDGLDDGIDLDGGFAGAHIGYNFVAGAWVFGVELEFGWSGLSGDVEGLLLGAPAGVDADLNRLGSTTARVGYAMDNVLIYGKGGVAYG